MWVASCFWGWSMNYVCSIAVRFLSSDYNSQKCFKKIKKNLCDYKFFAVYPNEISGMEEKQQHCFGTVLFQVLAIKWEAIKGTLVPNNPPDCGDRKRKGSLVLL